MDDRTICLPWDKNFSPRTDDENLQEVRRYPSVSILNTGGTLITFLGRLVPRPLLDFSKRGLGMHKTNTIIQSSFVIISTQAMSYLIHP